MSAATILPEIEPDAPRPVLPSLARHLVATGEVSATAMAEAQQAAGRSGVPLDDMLCARHGVSRHSVARAQANFCDTVLIDPVGNPPDARLLGRFGAARALRDGLLPWRRMGGCVLVLAVRAEQFHQSRSKLKSLFGDVRMAITTEDQLIKAVCRQSAPRLIAMAENRVPDAQSSRHWNRRAVIRGGVAVCLLLLCAALLAPVTLLAILCAVSVALLALNTGIKAAAALIGRGPSRSATAPTAAIPARLPKITLLIPLYREREIAAHLLARLTAIDYPRELLDVCLVLEENDSTTRDSLGRARLQTWMRPIVVPDGTLKTKPRALNYALDFARGTLIGVYDAEDAPAPDQLRRVAQHFANAASDVACLQGTLDYYNSAANWLTRCFTIEYCSWFRVILPGYARMGLVVPLGGTTLFMRRDLLESLGGWDAHNVTEDADLGVRLARAGYRTEFLDSVTEEEANGRFWPWVKQRSRWLKGYAITYGVHMRAPRALYRDLGPWRFFGLQVLFAGTLAQFLLAPALWSFWLLPLGFGHPVADLLSPVSFWTMVGLFVLSEVVNFAISAVALKRAGKLWLLKWAPTLQFYFPLGSAAVYRGLLELAWKPFYWDKTEHGVLLTGALPVAAPEKAAAQTATPPLRPPLHQA